MWIGDSDYSALERLGVRFHAGAWERWDRGYVDLPEHWRYSSACSYQGQEGLIDVDWEF